MDQMGEGLLFPQEEAATRLLYREDDTNFKRRLNSAIQMSWVFNTAATIIICSLIFFALGLNLVMGIIVGVLMAMVSNLHLTLSRVTRASRWEVYKNRVVMPLGFRGGQRTIGFEDIERLEHRTGLAGDTVVINLSGGERITLDVEEQRRPLEALGLAYRQYDRSRGVPRTEIRIPVTEE